MTDFGLMSQAEQPVKDNNTMFLMLFPTRSRNRDVETEKTESRQEVARQTATWEKIEY